MSKARLVITAVFVDRQKPAEVASRYGVHRSWVYKLKARYEAEGEAALEPRSRRPKTSPTAIPAATVELIVQLRQQLSEQGLDAGPDTICWHLHHHHGITVSVTTVARYLTRRGLVTPEPKKRPKSSYIRSQTFASAPADGVTCSPRPPDSWAATGQPRRQHRAAIYVVAFGLLIMAGADYNTIVEWVEVGRKRPVTPMHGCDQSGAGP